MRSHPLLPGLLCLQTGRTKLAVWVARCPVCADGVALSVRTLGSPSDSPSGPAGEGDGPHLQPSVSHGTALAGLVSDPIFFVIVSSNCLLMVSIFIGIPSAVPDPGSEQESCLIVSLV